MQRNHMGDLGIDDRIVLQWMFKNEDGIEDKRIVKYKPKEGENSDGEGNGRGNNWRRLRFLNLIRENEEDIRLSHKVRQHAIRENRTSRGKYKNDKRCKKKKQLQHT
jgi:hypothetical protein